MNDARGAAAGSGWVASDISTAFTPPWGPAIPASAVGYATGAIDAAGYTGLSLEDLRLATALHDVGKIGVPDSILLKPGSLSADERATIQRHAQIGYQLLAGSTSELLRIAAVIALTHHEWWDGAGYPRVLQRAEFPEEAGIVAISDIFDALTSNRVYRPALPFDHAIAIMGNCLPSARHRCWPSPSAPTEPSIPVGPMWS